jgi:serine acetyltransferase
VASGAIVTKSFPEGNQVLAGCPAKVVKQLPPYRAA